MQNHVVALFCLLALRSLPVGASVPPSPGSPSVSYSYLFPFLWPAPPLRPRPLIRAPSRFRRNPLDPPDPAPGSAPSPHLPSAQCPAPIGLFVHCPPCHWLIRSARPAHHAWQLSGPFRAGGASGGRVLPRGEATGGRGRTAAPPRPRPRSGAAPTAAETAPAHGGGWTDPRRLDARTLLREQVSEKCWGAPYFSASRGPPGRPVSPSR